MKIIPNNYENVLKDLIFKQFLQNIQKKTEEITEFGNIYNYINILANLEETLNNIVKESLVAQFDAIDEKYRTSLDRKAKYHIRAYDYRTILTIFGEITFRRTFYSNKDKEGCFCYLDEYLGLAKHDYFDPYIKATIVEYSSQHAMNKVCKLINDLVGSRVNINDKKQLFSRQTIRNIVMDAKISTPIVKEKETPKIIYIMADEKFVPTQRNNNTDAMVKSIVIYDDIAGTMKRKVLTNKRIFAGYISGEDLALKALDYIYDTYDTDKIETIFVMGDGAKWIKSLPREFKLSKNIDVIFALDKYHFKQALHHIFLDKDLEDEVSDFIIKNEKDKFINTIEDFLELTPHRADVINNKKEYILNNWNSIRRIYKYNLSCPMESQISHNLADLLTSRPKGYCINTLTKIIEMRMLYKNNENIKKLYFNNFNKEEIVQIDNNQLNLELYRDTYNSKLPKQVYNIFNTILKI